MAFPIRWKRLVYRLIKPLIRKSPAPGEPLTAVFVPVRESNPSRSWGLPDASAPLRPSIGSDAWTRRFSPRITSPRSPKRTRYGKWGEMAMWRRNKAVLIRLAKRKPLTKQFHYFHRHCYIAYSRQPSYHTKVRGGRASENRSHTFCMMFLRLVLDCLFSLFC